MGNRAIIKPVGKTTGLYLHWNGGRESVEPFLKYCELRGFRSIEDTYGLARLCQVIANFFGGSLSIGIESNIDETLEDELSWLDNGVYEVKGWEISNHYSAYGDDDEEEIDETRMKQMLLEIDNAQPPADRLGEEFLNGRMVSCEDLVVGDQIFVMSSNERWDKCTVIEYPDEGGEYCLGYLSHWSSVIPLKPSEMYRVVD